MAYLLLSLLYLGIIVAEVPPLIHQKAWKDLIVFSVILLIGVIYGYGMLANLSLPQPANGIKYVFEPVSRHLRLLP